MNHDLFFDFSKLKPNGYHYVAIGFSLPYVLHLPIDCYDIDVEINLENQTGFLNIQIIIEDHWKNQEEGHQKFPFAEENILIEREHDRQAFYRYTKVWVFIPTFSNDPSKPKDLNSIWDQVTRTRDSYHALAIKSVNRFLEIYRFHSKEFHIKSLAGRELWFDFIFAFMFNENLPQSSNSNFTIKIVPINYWGDIYPQLSNVPDRIVSNIQKQLTSPQEVPLSENLLLNAYDHLDRGNFRLSILEAETAFEAAIYIHLQSFYSDEPDKLQKIDKINSFTSLLRSRVCRKALGEINFEETTEYPDWESKVWKIRGALVHGKQLQVSEQEANEAVRIVEKILTYLLERPKTTPYQFLSKQI
ncbi:hypothetical protein MNBD_CHLOROFLEXI01-3733 [hydrothermal vent metagenome]|uniref:Apea-like HEPN domain-containing protein n=1 Tax=hydrothermal vent metagenome TaxID=652676 RepID=A0A3B0W6S0_9ZZZZ